ncbi:MAG: exo-alpha-sialidase, partial [Nitrososphaerota archaeon]|nr:exo-alpha-sialidase [Nitrososphaerota archaeon]
AVWATDNAGKEWAPLDSGLPNVSYFTVLRDAMVNDQEDPCGLYFGTTTGQLFASSDQGNHWTKITDGLPPVLSVSASAV